MALPDDEAFDAIHDFLVGTPDLDAAWDPAYAPLIFENEGDDAPAGPPAPWVAVIVDTNIYGQQSIGAGPDQASNRWDEDGTVWFHVFVPRGTKSREARKIAKGLVNLFRGRTLLDERLEFGDANMGDGDPARENAGYYLLSASLEWRFIEAT